MIYLEGPLTLKQKITDVKTIHNCVWNTAVVEHDDLPGQRVVHDEGTIGYFLLIF